MWKLRCTYLYITLKSHKKSKVENKNYLENNEKKRTVILQIIRHRKMYTSNIKNAFI